jgi:hypothetical protein
MRDLIPESKAEKKWCRHTRYPLNVGTEAAPIWVVVNRKSDNANPSWARCQTKECMDWEREYDRELREHVGKCTRD